MHAFAWLLGWVFLVVVSLAVYWVIVVPCSKIFGYFAPRIEGWPRKVKAFVDDGEKVTPAVAIVCLVLAIPIFIAGPDKTIEYIKQRVDQSKSVQIIDATEIRQFKLISMSSPKHVYVALEDVKTRTTYSNLYVSKHCSVGQNRLGDIYNIKVTYSHMSKTDQEPRHTITFVNLNSVFC